MEATRKKPRKPIDRRRMTGSNPTDAADPVALAK